MIISLAEEVRLIEMFGYGKTTETRRNHQYTLPICGKGNRFGLIEDEKNAEEREENYLCFLKCYQYRFYHFQLLFEVLYFCY